jgi:hypothetical protein
MSVPYPDDGLSYRTFPISGDDGFPQTFHFTIEGSAYVATVGVTWLDPATVLEPDPGTFYELPDSQDGINLTLRIDRDDGSPNPMIAIRRIALDRPLAFGSLRIRFKRLSIAVANLQDPGTAGSIVVGEIAVAS